MYFTVVRQLVIPRTIRVGNGVFILCDASSVTLKKMDTRKFCVLMKPNFLEKKCCWYQKVA